MKWRHSAAGGASAEGFLKTSAMTCSEVYLNPEKADCLSFITLTQLLNDLKIDLL